MSKNIKKFGETRHCRNNTHKKVAQKYLYLLTLLFSYGRIILSKFIIFLFSEGREK